MLFGFYSKVAGIFKRANLICNPKYCISSTFLLLHSLLSTQISLQFHYLDNLWPTGKRIHAGTHYISCHDWRPLSINLVLRKYLTASPYAYSLHDVSYTPFPWTSYILAFLLNLQLPLISHAWFGSRLDFQVWKSYRMKIQVTNPNPEIVHFYSMRVDYMAILPLHLLKDEQYLVRYFYDLDFLF